MAYDTYNMILIWYNKDLNEQPMNNNNSLLSSLFFTRLHDSSFPNDQVDEQLDDVSTLYNESLIMQYTSSI